MLGCMYALLRTLAFSYSSLGHTYALLRTLTANLWIQMYRFLDSDNGFRVPICFMTYTISDAEYPLLSDFVLQHQI